MTRSLTNILTTGSVLAATIIAPIAVSAQTVSPTTTNATAEHDAPGHRGGKGFGRVHPPGAFPAGNHGGHGARGIQGPRGNMHGGTVTAVNGTSITITGRDKTVYTIDASAAKLSKGFGKNATTITTSNIAVGDMIMVNGPLTGTSIAATTINDIGTPPVHTAGTRSLPFFGGWNK